jgi:hypothetical protein
MAGGFPDHSGPLKTQEIRLLELYPSTNDCDAIQCRLFRVTLEAGRVHPYEALSYVWGDATMRADVYCNGQLISVTPNLYDALNRLRLLQESRFIWADAICIDQSNSAEKSCQIPLMGKIYSLADKVVVWLGKANLLQPQIGLKYMELIAEQFRKAREEGGYDEISLEEYRKLQVPRHYTGESTQVFLRQLYARTWFSRVWCIQEVILARDVVMLWGELELSWEDVGQMAKWLSEIQPVRALEFDDNAFYANIDYENANRMYQLRQKRRDLLDSLDDCRAFQATDPRDKVYGILALVEPAEEAKAVCVNYAKDTGEVYAEAAVAVIQLYSDLTVLAYVDHGSEYHSDGSFTSWSPRWHVNGGLRRFPAEGSPLSACRNMMVKSVDASDLKSRYIGLKGLLYDRITIVHVEMNREYMINDGEPPFLDILVAVLGRPFPEGHISEEVTRALARTLTAGCDSTMDDIANANAEQQELFYTSFALFIQCTVAGLNFLDFRKTQSEQESFYDEAEIVCTGRRFFHTADGHFGLGPACMREGDIVAVLFGGHAPYVLRPCGRSYIYMGQAYVDEIMDGQLVDQMEAGWIPEKEFFLV